MSQGTIFYLPNAGRSDWLASFSKELGLDMNAESYKQEDGSYNPVFGKEFPLGKTPAFINSKGFKLTETVAIITYLTELAQKKGGETFEEKAHVLQWLAYLNSDVLVPYYNVRFHPNNKQDKDSNLERVRSSLKFIDDHLSQNKYLAGGDQYTSADVFGAWTLSKFALIIDDLTSYVHISNWIKDLELVSPTVKQKIEQRGSSASFF